MGYNYDKPRFMKKLIILLLILPLFAHAQDMVKMSAAADTVFGKITNVDMSNVSLTTTANKEIKIPYYTVEWVSLDGEKMTFYDARVIFKKENFEFETLEKKGESYLYQAGESFNKSITNSVLAGGTFLLAGVLYGGFGRDGVYAEQERIVMAVVVIGGVVLFVSSIAQFIAVGNLLKKAGRQIESQSLKE